MCQLESPPRLHLWVRCTGLCDGVHLQNSKQVVASIRFLCKAYASLMAHDVKKPDVLPA